MGLLEWVKKQNIASGNDSVEANKTRVVPLNVDTWKYHSYNGKLMTMDIVVACIDALARNIGKVELQAVRRHGTEAGIVDTTSDVARVLRKPNPYMSTYDFMYKCASLYFATNNLFIWPEYDNYGKLIALWPINYQNFNMVRQDGYLIAKFQLNYFHTYYVPYNNLIHLKNHFFTDDLFGDSNDAISPIAELIDTQNKGIISGIKNSAVIRGILKSVNVIRESDLQKAREQFQKDNLSATNNGGVIAIDGKFDYQNIESKPYVIDDESMKAAESKIFKYFGVNEAFLQNTFTSDQYEAIYEGRIEPFAIMFTQGMTDKLFRDRRSRDDGMVIEANMAKVKYQPTTIVTAVITATNQLGLFTRDEYREMLGYAPLGPEKGGDQIMIAANNYVAEDSIGAEEEMPDDEMVDEEEPIDDTEAEDTETEEDDSDDEVTKMLDEFQAEMDKMLND